MIFYGGMCLLVNEWPLLIMELQQTQSRSSYSLSLMLALLASGAVVHLAYKTGSSYSGPL